MASLKERASATLARLREKYPWLDHVLRMVEHYGAVNGNGQAGAVTFFGFLSFFPILALAFFVIGLLAHLYPEVKGQMVHEIGTFLPGVIGPGKGEISLKTMEGYSGRVGLIGLAALLYSGLGWLSGLRQALEVMFVVPRREQPNFIVGKLLDLGTLALIGLTLLLSVVLSGAVTGFTGAILGWVGVDSSAVVPAVLLGVLARLLAIAASTVLLLAMFKLLVVDPHCPPRSLLSGAVLGAFGFEALKLAAGLLLAQTKGNPAFQAFGVALILLVWINYFSRLVMYAAAWAYTSPAALAQRTAEARRAPGAALATEQAEEEAADESRPREPSRPQGARSWRAVAGAGVLAALATALLRGRRHGES